MMPDWNNRKAKIFQRIELFKGVGPRLHYITLGGATCLDIDQGRKLGVLKEGTTQITSVEQKKCEYEKMCNWLVENWHGLPKQVKTVHGPLSQFLDLEEYDMVFLDYLGNITKPDAHWIKQKLSKNLVNGACVGITVAKPTRGNLFIPSLKNELLTKFGSYYKEISRQICNSGNYPHSSLAHLTTYFILIDCYLFSEYSCEIKMDYYRDSSSYLMFLLKMSNMFRVKNRLDETQRKIHCCISDLVLQHQHLNGIAIGSSDVTFPSFLFSKDNVMKEVIASVVIETIVSAQTPGKKAFATKLQNAYLDQKEAAGGNRKRVLAAIKAHVTRQLNVADRKRVKESNVV